MDDLEVVMVDDGSTDDSAALAAAFAEQDSRFRLVSQKNGGLGHARNTGVRNCDPDSGYVAFVDSDDIVPPRAYELLVGALDETGSDIASGNVLRLRASGKLQQSPNFRKPMATTRLRTHISRDWDLAADRIACNKVFRRSFWDEHAFAFPVGTLYEDIPVVLPAHFLARSVDVVKDAVYHWRDRAARSPPAAPSSAASGTGPRTYWASPPSSNSTAAPPTNATTRRMSSPTTSGTSWRRCPTGTTNTVAPSSRTPTSSPTRSTRPSSTGCRCGCG